MEAYVWASTDSHLGVATSIRVFGSVEDAQKDAQECIGDACPIEWTSDDGESWTGEFQDSNGMDGTVVVNVIKVSL